MKLNDSTSGKVDGGLSTADGPPDHKDRSFVMSAQCISDHRPTKVMATFLEPKIRMHDESTPLGIKERSWTRSWHAGACVGRIF